MSLVTKTLHRKNYPAIDAAAPERSQAGRKILIIGGAGVIGAGAARAFVTAGADTVVITSRDAAKAARIAGEMESEGQGKTKVRGYGMELKEIDSVRALWDSLARDQIELDTLILNACLFVPAEPEDDQLTTLWVHFEASLRNNLVSVDRFRAQGPKQGKVLLYISSNVVHLYPMPLYFTAASSPRIALTRMMIDLAINTSAETMQVMITHPGLILTEENAKAGYNKDSLAPIQFDEASLAANFYVWATTKEAAFLHGRMLWTTWDVDELKEMKPKLEADSGFLRVGLQGVASQDFGMLMQGMGRAV